MKDQEEKFVFMSRVPGDIFSSLVEAGLMPHPYKGRNKLLFRDLEDLTWIYERTFHVDSTDFKVIELVVEGIDTFSRIYINGALVGQTQNMFLEYRFDIKDVLKTGENTVRVEILPSKVIGETLERNFGKLNSTEATFRAYIRKAQFSFGWDWGPRLPSGGIWKDIYIELRNSPRLFGSTAYIRNVQDFPNVEGYIFGCSGENDLQVDVFVNGKSAGTFPVFCNSQGQGFFSAALKEKLPLWRPNGLGKQNLHEFRFVLKKSGKAIYEEKKTIGLRSVEILQEKDEEGQSFIFVVNGQKFFAKGANWIPADALLGWAKPEKYERLLEMAKDAGMNMLRVWGGGIYEKDIFYDLCDRFGIMVWQDFMFSCSEYPDHLEWFRKLAKEEAWQNVVRLRHHPSIVIWCGNNENNWGFQEWGFDNKPDGINLGNRLYLFDFPEICASESPSTPYWPSSPYGGERANSEKAGDTHIWDVWSGWKDFREYEKKTGRFVSEFGFQAFPDLKTVQFFTKERNILSEDIMHHNKQIEGMERLMKFIFSEIGILKDLEDIILASQFVQAEAIKTGVERFRSRKYKTAGTLYWQLNDVWPVISWSAVDWLLNPKALYYYTKRFYSPVIAAISAGEIFIINDLRKELTTDDLTVQVYRADGKLLYEKTYKGVFVPEDGIANLGKLSADGDIAFLESKSLNLRNHKLLRKPRLMNLKKPEIEIEMEEDSLVITSKDLAIGVFIKGCQDIEDNFLTMKPGEKVRLRARGCQNSKIATINELVLKAKDLS